MDVSCDAGLKWDKLVTGVSAGSQGRRNQALQVEWSDSNGGRFGGIVIQALAAAGNGLEISVVTWADIDKEAQDSQRTILLIRNEKNNKATLMNKKK